MRALSVIETLRRPLVVAPMAGVSTPALVAAASEAGALGSIGAAYDTPETIAETVSQVRARTGKPFAINLFVPAPETALTSEVVAAAVRSTAHFRAEFGLPPPRVHPPFALDFGAQFEATLRARPAVLSFVFGIPSDEYVRAARREGLYLIGTATTFEEARSCAEAGMDAVTLQGLEAGGHRGTFDGAAPDPDVAIRELIRTCAGRLNIPLIAAGGLMHATDVREMLALGASAVQMGTAFLACREAGTSSPWRERLRGQRRTLLTRAFSGRLARGLENRFTREMEGRAILPFPAQNAFTRDLRRASLARGSDELLSLWCGTGAGELWTGPAADLIERLFA